MPMSSTRQLFGTDGVRGVANLEPMTPEIALRLGQALAQRCQSGGARPRIVIGRDTRLSGDMLEAALVAGITSMGADVLLAGVLPTPAIAFLTRSLPADAGVVVSASHNPFPDNGIKLFAATGFKLPDAVEHAIEQLVLNGDREAPRPTAAAVGRGVRLDDAAERYLHHLGGVVPAGLRLDGLRVVLDCAHGAAHRVGPAIFRGLGADVVAIGIEPDGTNINAGCGAVHPKRLQDAVRAAQAQLGVALDGDADRAMLVDEAGAVVDGDQMLAMFATDMLARGTLHGSTVVATVMSNLGLEIALRERGVRLARTAVGDRYVVEEMQRGGFNLGGEQSGHLILLDHGTTGDGLAAGLMAASLLVARQRPLGELTDVMTKLPQVLLNVRLARREDLDTIPAVRQAIEAVRVALHDRGRVLVRYSGTEPLVRVMVEGEDAARTEAYAHDIAATIQRHLGSISPKHTADYAD
jgi:phosphoglucosamine mutase